jgi:hypothetical protein
VTAQVRPTLLNGCASAATAAEARFRIDRPIAGGSARVIALDEGAADVVRRVADHPWGGARFLTSETWTPGAADGNGASADIVLRAIDGSTSRLDEELADADVAIMIATSDDGAEAASAIARACAKRGITTAGLILGDRLETGAAVSALRPYARILMATADEDDVSEVLTALRA